MRFLDLTQDFSLHTPAFAGYPGPAIRWIKHLAFDRAGGQEITMTLHVSTHLDAPAHFERWEKDTGHKIERSDILVIHTGYHKFYPENWTDRSEADETRYFIRHPGPTRAFAEWVVDGGVRWIAVDAGSADHPMNTVIRRIRADEAAEAEKKLVRSLDEIFPKADYQVMHTLLFPHDIIHIENLGGQIDEVLNQKISSRLR